MVRYIVGFVDTESCLGHVLDENEEMFAKIRFELIYRTKTFALLVLYNFTLAIIIINILLIDFFSDDLSKTLPPIFTKFLYLIRHKIKVLKY